MKENNSSYPNGNSNELPRDFTGEIYSFTIVHLGFGHMAKKTPYALLMVNPSSMPDKTELLMGILYPKDTNSVAIGQTVKLSKFDPEIGNIFSVI